MFVIFLSGDATVLMNSIISDSLSKPSEVGDSTNGKVSSYSDQRGAGSSPQNILHWSYFENPSVKIKELQLVSTFASFEAACSHSAVKRFKLSMTSVSSRLICCAAPDFS